MSEGWSTAILLAIMLLSITGSISAANWADGLDILLWAALAGLALGILLAKLPVRGYVAHPFMLVAGIPIVALDASTLLPHVMTLDEKWIVLEERFLVWISKATFGGSSTDNLMFVVQCAYFAWIMAYVAGWSVYRHRNVWGAILPTGFALLFNLFYALPQPGIYIGMFLLSAMLLVVRVNLQGLERWWRRAAVGYAADVNFDFLLYGGLFSVLLMFFAWTLPASASGPAWLMPLAPVEGPWQDVQDQFNRVFSSLRSVGRPAPSSFYGMSLAMGGPVHLGNRPVMDIETVTGRYWRAAVYDKYTGVGWISTHQDVLNLGVGDPRLEMSGDNGLRVSITQTYTIYLADQNILYAESQPVEFSLPIELRYGQPPATDPAAPMLDITMTRSRRTLRDGDTYAVVSSISVADADSLRQAATYYAPWIAATYLQLPDALPERVRTLAKTLTAKATNPYDKAAAIETYLRAKIKYNDDVSEPPQGRDGVDYTLFDRPEGYCNYYASAMVVLARAVGVPARVASGYSLGSNSDGVYHVVEANAHSWVEVYFPGYGWIEFEPTSSQPEIDRPQKQDLSAIEQSLTDLENQPTRRKSIKDIEDLDPSGSGGSVPFNSFWSNPANVTLAGTGLLALAGIAVLAFTTLKRARRIAGLPPAAQFYEKLIDRAGWIGVDVPDNATPFESANAIGDALPNARDQVLHATSLYVREQFGARSLAESERAELDATWTVVRGEWWRALILRILLRIITPPRELARNIARAVERWGKG